MRVHIIFAHPNIESYNGQLRNVAIETLEKSGCKVSVSDLYQMKFKASADADDFTAHYDLDFFDLQKEQQFALQNNTFSPDIIKEQQFLSESDLIIFQFPLWWHNVPALLKGYIDRVISMGWAYGGGKALEGKKALVCMTTGAPEFIWTDDKRGTIKDTFRHLFVGTLEHIGMVNLEPFIVYGAKRHTEQDRKQILENYSKVLEQIIE